MASNFYNGAYYGVGTSDQRSPDDKKPDMPSIVEVQEANEAVNNFRDLLGRLGITPGLVRFITHLVELQETRFRCDLCAIASAVILEFHTIYVAKTAKEILQLQPQRIKEAINTRRPDRSIIDRGSVDLQHGYSLGYTDCVSQLEDILAGR